MKKKLIIIFSICGIIAIIIGILLLNKTKEYQNKIEIIDATYGCAKVTEKFYEDDKYIYSFPCTKSNSIYVKFENGNKVLIVNALEEKKVTIDELIDAGLEVYKEEK